MKKTYNTPTVELTLINTAEDILVYSIEQTLFGRDPGIEDFEFPI